MWKKNWKHQRINWTNDQEWIGRPIQIDMLSASLLTMPSWTRGDIHHSSPDKVVSCKFCRRLIGAKYLHQFPKEIERKITRERAVRVTASTHLRCQEGWWFRRRLLARAKRSTVSSQVEVCLAPMKSLRLSKMFEFRESQRRRIVFLNFVTGSSG